MFFLRENSALAKSVYEQLIEKTNGLDARVTCHTNSMFIIVRVEGDVVIQTSLEYYISEQILYIICTNFKRKYLELNVKIKGEEKYVDLLLDALVEFDRESDFFLLQKNIDLQSKLYVESFYEFKLSSLREKWSAALSIANNNSYYFQNQSSFVEFIRFLVENIEICNDCVNVVVEGERVQLFDSNFKKIVFSSGNLTSKLISLSPKKINCYIGGNGSNSDIKTMFDIFTNRVTTYPLDNLI